MVFCPVLELQKISGYFEYWNCSPDLDALMLLPASQKQPPSPLSSPPPPSPLRPLQLRCMYTFLNPPTQLQKSVNHDLG